MAETIVSNISSSLCTCLEASSQGVINEMSRRINSIVREKTRLNNFLRRAPLKPSLGLGNLQATLTAVVGFDEELQRRAEQGFPFPPEGNISLGEITRCLNAQVTVGLGNTLGDFDPLASAWCILNKTANLLQGLVDDITPKLDAQLSFGCDPGTVAGLQGQIDSLLGSVGASTDGTFDIATLTADSLVDIGTDYYNAFNDIVRCCLNVEGIKDTMKTLITDPFSGDPFNLITFEPEVAGVPIL